MLKLNWNVRNLNLSMCSFLVEQKTGKSRLFKAEPLPICKMKNDCMNDMTRCRSFLDRRNYFFKEGQWC